ncbi:hypothetical protein BKA66DRAFT_146538 [Pyrenochaeta sp. MPI-SDFR-AT-0127]|nr:hypothetical protein BKA66DRAFT_146538 [Pyrenochaeta sp. MPI-SDFR-AT-0127]
MASSDWRMSLGFSARLSAVTKITSDLQTSDPSLSAADARGKATITETQIYSEAKSAEEYTQLCNTITNDSPRQTLEFPTSEVRANIVTTSGSY